MWASLAASGVGPLLRESSALIGQATAPHAALAAPAALSAGAVEAPKPEQGPSGASVAAQQLPRPPRRRGCQHCITCSGLQHHCHSMTVR